MTKVRVQRDANGSRTAPVFHELEQRIDAVRQRAFDIFSSHAPDGRHRLDDWLAAEREVLGWPAAELREDDGAYALDIDLAGYSPDDVEVTATPEEIVVRAHRASEASSRSGAVLWSEFGERDVFRRCALPTPVRVNAISAELDDGLLHIVAPKSNGEAGSQRRR